MQSIEIQVRREWIGPVPKMSHVVAVFYIGIIGIMIAGLQPLLLGTLQAAGSLTAGELGHAATAELLTMGLAASAAGAWLKPIGLRWIGLASALALAGVDLVTPQMRHEAVTAIRALAGVPSGLLMWVTFGMITRAPRPERWSGAYLTLQTLAQFGLSSLLTAFVVGPYGAGGGFIALGALSGLAGLAALLGPSHYAPLHDAERPAGLPTARGFAALAACFLFLACIVGVWVYAEPLSHQAGHVPSIAGTAVSLSLLFQVLGGGAATVLAGRIGWFRALLVCSLADLAMIGVFATLPSAPVFLATSAVFGFFWLFMMPFLVPMTIEADPTRRAAMLLGGAQLLGGSLGPLMASALVSDADVRGALAFGVGCLAASMAIVVAIHRTAARAR